MCIAGLVLGIVVTLCGIGMIVLSAVGIHNAF